MDEEIPNKTTGNKEDNNKSNSGGILKYALVSLVLLAKIFAFMHINQHNPSDQSNTSDNESSASEIVGPPANKTDDTPASECFHALFYSHIGWGHVVIDVLIYIILAVLFGIVSFKLAYSLIRDGNKKG